MPARLADDEVALWVRRSDIRVTAKEREQLEAVLLPAEIRDAGRLRFQRDRAERMRARALLRSALSHYDGCPAKTWRFISRLGGRPELDDESEFRFSVSHSDGLIAVAVTRCRDVGIDLESRERVVDPVPVAREVFSLGEASWVATTDTVRRFAMLWTLKEAFAKATGLGIGKDMLSHQFAVDDDRIVSPTPTGSSLFFRSTDTCSRSPLP
jgi:4'-phosphopantetheinyl transferase